MFEKVAIPVLASSMRHEPAMCARSAATRSTYSAPAAARAWPAEHGVQLLGALPLGYPRCAKGRQWRADGGERARHAARRGLCRDGRHTAGALARRGRIGAASFRKSSSRRAETVMSIKSDPGSRRIGPPRPGMIEPFAGTARCGAVGCTRSSPTARRATVTTCVAPPRIQDLHNINSTIVDPKQFDAKSFGRRDRGRDASFRPNSFALARTVEYFAIPRNVLTICLGKSTYARCGIIVNVTPLEPEWEGHVTLEFSNTTAAPAKIYANEGVAQMLFFESDEVARPHYRDRGGKYMGQQGVTLPKA